MATTSRPIELFALGMRDTTGAVLASGIARFYQPGTLVAQTVYSDSGCTVAYSQPITLSAAGQATIYTLEAVRCIVKDSTDTTTIYDGVVNLNRHDAVYITHASFNGGAETTLENVLTSLGTNLGTDGNYLESAGATPIGYSAFLGQLVVSVKNFGATGNGSTDDTVAIQAAFDRMEARGGGWVYFPVGTYRIIAPITIDTAGVSAFGAGRGIAVIRNDSTTGNAITVNLGSAVDSKIVFRDFSITANTTSSGSGIAFTNGDKPVLQGIGVALHRTGIATSAVTGAMLQQIFVDSTDNNAAAVGVSLGARGKIMASEIVSSTTNGTGISAAGDNSRAVGCYVSGFATGTTLAGVSSVMDNCLTAGSTTGVTASGTDSMVRNSNFSTTVATAVSLTGTRSSAVGCSASPTTTAYSLTGTNAFVRDSSGASCTTGFSLGAASASVTGCHATSCTTGFSVGAFASCVVVACRGTSNTTDLAVNASATLLIEHSNTFSVLSDSATTPHSWLKDRGKALKITKVVDSTGTPSFTPTPQTCDVFVCESTYSASGVNGTINNTSTTGLVDGQLLTIVLQKTNTNNWNNTTWGAQYSGTVTSTTVSSGAAIVQHYMWRASSSRWALIGGIAVTMPATNVNLW